MCELLGMNANVPTDICFSFAGLRERGGRTGPHKDGWGIAFYEGKGLREFRDPGAGCDSKIAAMVSEFPIKSTTVVSHIRQANSGRVCLENTHPFIRELWGQYWVFAHNGQLRGIKQTVLPHYQTIGTTDSEHAFCWLLGTLRARFPKRPAVKTLWKTLHQLCQQIAQYGVCNLLFSDGRYLYCYCTTHLHWITRQSPFRQATLTDAQLSVDFCSLTTPDDVVSVVATQPLTCNEQWYAFQKDEFCVFEKGERVFVAHA